MSICLMLYTADEWSCNANRVDVQEGFDSALGAWAKWTLFEDILQR